MKFDFIQTSFAAGEIGPDLRGRRDFVQYANACEIVENLIPTSYGPLISAPGSTYVATVSDSSLKTRLMKFVFNRQDAYAIEMGDSYNRYYTNRGQVVTKIGTEDLSAFSANLKAHWKCNDNAATSTVTDAVGTHDGTASTLTTSLSTTAIVSTGFDLKGLYHISVVDHNNFTRTTSSQPMTFCGWFYYTPNTATQTLYSKAGEYIFYVDSSDRLSYKIQTSPTTIVDSSSTTKTVALNGDAQISTVNSKFGGSSALFDGTGDYITITNHTDFDIGTGDFTIDFQLNFTTTAGTQYLFERYNVSDDFTLFWETSSGLLKLRNNSVNMKSEAWSPASATWYHVAITRSGTNLDFWINGAKLGTTTTNSTNINVSDDVVIGIHRSGGTTPFSGYIDEFRWTKNLARWTSNFTAPTTEYTSDSSTALLLHLNVAVNTWTVGQAITKGWHFFAVVSSGTGSLISDCNFYLDGVSVGTSFLSNGTFTNMSNTTSLFRIGTKSSAGEDKWAGKIDNIAFLHQALTTSELASLYSTTPYQLSTVFKENEVFDAHYTQLNDIIWISHPNHFPQKLVRTSANEWAIANAPIIGGPFLDTNITTVTMTPSATTGTINITVTPTTTTLFTKSGSTLGHHGAYWMIGGLAQTNTTTGIQEVGYVQITYVTNSYTATATVIKNLKAATATTYWAEGAWSAVRGYPARVSIHDFRLWFARTSYEPQKEWASKLYEYENFALDTETDEDALNLPLSSTESNEIQWLVSGGNLLAGTYGGAFVTSSGGDDITITPSNANSKEQIGFGSEPIMPKKIGSFIYFIQRFGKKLREMFYFTDNATYKSVDRTILSPHILGDGVIDMDLQQNPMPILYCVRTDGTLALMTREVDQEVTGWSRRTTNGTYTSVAVIPSQTANYDECWSIVERYINGSKVKYVEYFEDIKIPDRQDKCVYLDSSLSYDAYESTSLSVATISLSQSTGSVTVTSSTAYFNSGMTNKRMRAINDLGVTLGEGVLTAYSSTTSMTLSITTTFNALSYLPGYWGVSVSSLSGLSHLEAKTVGILADGVEESLTRTVASGVVTLGSNYFVICVGLSYDQIALLLPKEQGSQRGTAHGKLQRFSEIFFQVYRSTQNFRFGQDSTTLDYVNKAFTPTSTTLYTGILPPSEGSITMLGGYSRGAKIYIKNSSPLPLHLLSVSGALDTIDK